jgi:hypothetical protein
MKTLNSLHLEAMACPVTQAAIKSSALPPGEIGKPPQAMPPC